MASIGERTPKLPRGTATSTTAAGHVQPPPDAASGSASAAAATKDDFKKTKQRDPPLQSQPLGASHALSHTAATAAIQHCINHAVITGHLDLPNIFATLKISDPANAYKAMGSGGPLDQLVLALADLPEQKWKKIVSVTTLSGTHETIAGKPANVIALEMAPGEIDQNLCYRDGATYTEPVKAQILAHEITALHLPPEEHAFVHALMMEYHPYVGSDNRNFIKIATQWVERSTFDAPALMAKLHKLLKNVSVRWTEHLQVLRATNPVPPSDIVILTSDGGTAHLTAATTVADELKSKGYRVRIVNETTDLGPDPLERAIGFKRGWAFREIKQKRNNPILYQALNRLHNRLAGVLHDDRMDALRIQVGEAPVVVSLNTFAHDARLITDGKHVVFDVIDTGPINGKLTWLAKHVKDFHIEGAQILTHDGDAFTVDDAGRPVIAAGDGFVRTRYPVDDPPQADPAAFLHALNPTGTRRLSVLSFGGQGCKGKVGQFLDAFIDNRELAHDRDLLLLVGSNTALSIEEVQAYLTARKISFSSIVAGDDPVTSPHTFIITNRDGRDLRIRVMPSLNRIQMRSLASATDHFIIKPGAATTHEALAWGARGIVAYFDGTHGWERGNLSVLAHAGSGIVYDSTSSHSIAETLLRTAGKPSHVAEEDTCPTVADVVVSHLTQSRVAVAKVSSHQASPLDDDNVERAVNRLFAATKGHLEKPRDRLVPLRASNPALLREELSTFIHDFFTLAEQLTDADLASIGHDESPKIKEIRARLIQAESTLLDLPEDAPSFLRGPGDRPIILWTGFAAMDASLADATREYHGICNFSVPLCNILFIAWEEQFASARTLEGAPITTAIPPTLNPVLRQYARSTQDLRRQIDTDVASGSDQQQVAAKFFGQSLTVEEKRLAETTGVLVSKLFASTFSTGSARPIVIASINRIAEFKTKHPVLATDTILWDHELPVLRHVRQDVSPRFFFVDESNTMREYPLEEFRLVRSRWRPQDGSDTALTFRDSYTIGMPHWPEWLFWSAQPARPTTTVAKMTSWSKTRRAKATK